MKIAPVFSQFDWVYRDVRDLVLNQNLQSKRSRFILKSMAQSLNSCALDDVLKLAADASVGAFNLLSDSGSYRFGSLDESSRSIAIALAAFSALSTAAVMSPAGPRGKENPKNAHTRTRVLPCAKFTVGCRNSS